MRFTRLPALLAGITAGIVLLWLGSRGSTSQRVEQEPPEVVSMRAPEAHTASTRMQPGADRFGPKPAPDQEPRDDRRPAGSQKGIALFAGEPLGIPESRRTDSEAHARAEQASALRPRLQQRLDAMRARLAAAPVAERENLRLDIMRLERNLQHRNQRLTGAAPHRSTLRE